MTRTATTGFKLSMAQPAFLFWASIMEWLADLNWVSNFCGSPACEYWASNTLWLDPARHIWASSNFRLNRTSYSGFKFIMARIFSLAPPSWAT
jgi:hypothetical protein